MTRKTTRRALGVGQLGAGRRAGARWTESQFIRGRGYETIWGSESPTGARTATDRAFVELGTAFRVDVDGEITGIRYWRGSSWWSPVGTRTGTLWTAGGRRIQRLSFRVWAGRVGDRVLCVTRRCEGG